MSGILDNKSRVLDAILTYEGRRQIAAGNFVVKYATFSDKEVVYQLDSDEGHVDPTKKIYLEAYNSTNDQITFEADDSGKLRPFRQHASFDESSYDDVQKGIAWKSFINGKLQSRLQLYADNTNVTGSFSENLITGNTFASQLQGILSSSIDNFNRLGILSTSDNLFEDHFFSLNNNLITFDAKLNTENGFLNMPVSVNYLPSLFQDKRAKNVINFQYLPPIKKANYSIDKTNIELLQSASLFLGNYPPWGMTKEYTLSKIIGDLDDADYKTIKFDPTSRGNNLVSQFFEVSNYEAKKLDVIEFGKISNNTNNPLQASQHVFFVGKVITDDNDTNSFVHMFTIIFENDDEL